MSAIAVIGLAGRFPGAADAAALWRNLVAGKESLTRFEEADLLASGVDPALLADPHYVPVAGVIEDFDRFDAALFGYSPREAQLLDPQHRHFLEVVWAALESAGYDPTACPGPVGVFAGAKLNTYLLENLLPNRDRFDQLGLLGAVVGNDKDFLATAVSYRLGLTGPSMTVQTACSTSLVATHLACQSLLSGESDVAVAGGAAISVPHRVGYRYHEGSIFSPDGACRAFAADAGGTVAGSGAAAVVLRRLDDALADGDPIRAVILSSAVNNDGRRKVGFTAPGVDGQTRVIAEALAMAGVSAESIGYVEAHGTGTQLGDPIEITALTDAFRGDTARTGYCGLGSIKPNIGHLDAAAGVTGLIKAVLAVETGVIPPSLHAATTNPAARLSESPFFVPGEPTPWRVPGLRRAGVSSFGIGGTNAHVIVEQAPTVPVTLSESDGPEVIVMSARTPQALAQARDRLAATFADGQAALADIATTLHTGRKVFPHRIAVAARDLTEAADALAKARPAAAAADRPRVVYLFPGQGAQRPGVGAELYRGEPVYRAAIDHAAETLRPQLGLDLRGLLHADPADAQAAQMLTRTRFAQPALFTIGYALAELWQHWGVRPDAMVGHSIGEYVAAARAGVFELADALHIVARRGALMDALPIGAMLAVLSTADSVGDLLRDDLCLAAVNAPEICVLSGPVAAIAVAAETLADRGIRTRPVVTSHAFHSAMMDPAMAALHAELERIPLREPATPYLSSRTGDWISAREATDPGYWAAQLRDPVLFARGMATVTADVPDGWCVELGPGRTLTGLARLQLPAQGWSAQPGLGETGDRVAALDAAGAAWCAGVELDWSTIRNGRSGRRVPLPAYPFARDRHWIDPPQVTSRTALVEEIVADGAAADEIARIWQDVLGIETAEPDDDFYQLGGHSLAGAQLLSRLRARFGVELALDEVLGAVTLGKLTALVLGALPDEPVAQGFPRAQRDPEGMPLTGPQRRMWTLEQLNPGTATYHMPFAIRMRGPLDLTVLEQALCTVVARHEALRTRFVAVDGMPRQIADAPLGISLSISEPGRLQDEITRQFDLVNGPPVRFLLERHAADDHLLVVTAHHLVLDGWSVGVLVDELARCYADPSASLGPDPVQVADVAAHQTGDDDDYWAEALSGFTEPLDLGTQATVLSGAGGRVVTQASAETVNLIRPRLYPALLAALGVTLGRTYGTQRLVIGSPVANRFHPALERTVGLLASTVPIPVDIGGGAGLVDRVADTVRGALNHPNVALERLAAGWELFNVLLVLQNAPLPELRLGDLDLSIVDVHTRTAKFALTFDATPLPDGGLRLSLEYASEVCDETAAEQLLQRYLRVLTALAADPGLSAAELPLLDEREAKQVAGWTTGGTAYPARTVPSLVDGVSDAIAVIDETMTLTYAELARYSEEIATLLREQGVRRGGRVALCVPRSAAGVAAILAILRCGATYVPLDLSYPASRLSEMLGQAQAGFVLVNGVVTLPLAGHRVINLPRPGEVAAIEVAAESDVDDLCYIVFTSGSTGTPKGIGLSHRALGNLAQWQVQRSALPPQARTAQLTPYSFDVHFQEVFGTLAAGGTLIVASDELRRDPGALLSWLDRHQVRRIFLPYVLLAGLAQAARRTAAPQSLREVVTAGERLQVTETVREFFRRLPAGAVLDNHYGPAETHVVTAELLSGDPDDWWDLPLIGRPLPGVECVVVDRSDGQAGPGAPGELHLGGVQLFDGYLGQPEATERGRRYRTGDLVRWSADGSLEFLGRADDQVKIRGHRVEPAEIETVLSGHPDVRECAVVAEPGPDGRLRLVGYTVATTTPDALRAWLAERLPPALVPARVSLVDRLVRTPSGKIDRRSLTESAPASIRQTVAAGVPQSILAAFESILDAQVGPDDDFFALGGDSIMAIQLAARLTDAGHPVAPRDIFEHPTAAALARVTRVAAEPPKTMPATPRQLALRAAPAHFSWVCRNAAPLDPKVLRQQVDAVVRSQPALRARVTSVVTVVEQDPHALLHEVDLTSLTQDAAATRAQETGVSLAASLDPEHGPVFGVVWCRCPDGDWLGIAAHPSVVDNESFATLQNLSADATVDTGWLRWLTSSQPRQPGPGEHRTWPYEVQAAQELLAGRDVTLVRDAAPPTARAKGTLGQWGVEMLIHAGEQPPADLATAIRQVKMAPIPVSTMSTATTLTPADFPLVTLTEQQLNSLVGERGAPEDIYPLAPMQQTMLARVLAGGRPGMFAVRTCHPLPSATDPVALRVAFQHIVRRHPIMRTSFAWSGLPEPVQWVHPQTTLPWTELDWRDVAGPVLRSRMEEFLAQDFATPFHLGRAPLARCTLIRLRGGYELVFTAHHLLMDGWSRSLLLQDLPALYAAALRDRPTSARLRIALRQAALLPRVGLGGARSLLRAQRTAELPEPPAPFRDHLEVLSAADPAPAWRHWQDYLADSSDDGTTPAASCAVVAGGYRRIVATAPSSTADAVGALTRSHGITGAVAAQAAWALVLARATQKRTVRFGVTSSGRVWGLRAYPRMVGLFITTLPRRVPVPADQTAVALMRRIQADAARSQEAERVSLLDLEQQHGGRLFDTIVVVDNFPQDAQQHALGALLRRGHPFAGDHFDLGMTEFPLRLEVIPMNGLHVALCYHRDQFGDHDAEGMIRQWLELLAALAARPEATIGEL